MEDTGEGVNSFVDFGETALAQNFVKEQKIVVDFLFSNIL